MSEEPSGREELAQFLALSSGFAGYPRSVVTRFGDAIIVIMSEMHGCEYTCRDAYEPRCQGLWVWRCGSREWVQGRVLTTKTNDYVRVAHDGSQVTLVVP